MSNDKPKSSDYSFVKEATDRFKSANELKKPAKPTMLDLYAKDAPNEIPTWFRFDNPPRPEEPKSWVDYQQIGGAAYSTENIELLKEWQQVREHDLPEDLSWYQEQWEAYFKAKFEWEIACEIGRLAAWKFYYATAMLKEREKHI